MNPDAFLNTLRDFPANMVDALVKALASLWNRESSWAVDMTTPSCSCSAAVFTEELLAMRHRE